MMIAYPDKMQSTRHEVRFLRRGQIVRLECLLPRTTLLDWLRIEEGSTGTKEGCGEGDCGACTVVIARRRDGEMVYEPVNSCITLVGQIDGAELITVEDLADGDRLHPVQQAMARRHGSQCGFCTPGIVMSLFARYHDGSGASDRAAINNALAGNLCRCTGYRPIVEAALESCNSKKDDKFIRGAAQRLAMLESIDDANDLFVGVDDRFFAAPAHEDSLARLCTEHPEATIVAGATDVGLWITKQLATVEKVIHLGRLKDLAHIEESPNGYAIGAVVSVARAASVLAAIDADIGEVLRRFGSEQVRVCGTVGGNVANGSPIGDLAPMLIALSAGLELRRGDEVRRIPLEDFFLDYGKQDRRPGEFVRQLHVSKLSPGTHFRAYKISKRMDEDISAVLAALCIDLDGGCIRRARVAFGGMAAVPKRAKAVEAKLLGLPLADSSGWHAAAVAVGEDFTPLTDLRASAEYRLRVAGNLVIKALAEIGGLSSDVTRITNHRVSARAPK